MPKSGVINEGRRFGYARVSTAGQELDRQVRELTAAGCVHVFTDVVSGASADKPGLDELLKQLGRGDTFVACRLARVGRSARGLLSLVDELRERDVGFVSLQESIDTSTPMGRMVFTVLAAVAEWELEVIRERTVSGQAAARAKGVRFGRPPVTSDSVKVRDVRDLLDAGHTIKSAARVAKVSVSTVRRYARLTR